MASMDAAGASGGRETVHIDGLDKIAAFDKWLAQRFEEATQLQSRIDKRLEHLGRIEDSLRKLFESLRTQVFEVHPLLGKLAEAKRSSEASVAGIVQEAQKQIEQLGRPLQDQAALMRQVDEQLQAKLAAFQQQAQASLAPVAGELERTLAGAREQSGAIVQTLPMKVAEQVSAFKQQIDEAAKAAERTLGERSSDFVARAESFGDMVRKEVEGIFQQVREQARQELEPAEHQWQQRIAAKMLEHARLTEQELAEARGSLQAIVLGIESSLGVKVEAMCRQVDERIDRAARMVADVVEPAQRKLATLQETAEHLDAVVDDMLQRGIEQVSTRVSVHCDQVRYKLEEELRQHERRVQAALDAADRSLGTRLEQIQQTIASKGEAAHVGLQQAMEEFRTESAAAMESAKASLRQQVQSLQQEARWVVKPILAQISESEQAAVRQAQAAAQAMRQVLEQRIAELRRSGEEAVALVEQQLVQRLQAIKPQTQMALESAEQNLSRRLSQLAAHAQQIVETSEAQWSARLEEARPRALSILRSVEKELLDHIAKMEQDAGTQVGYLERRLMQRVDQVANRSRRTLADQTQELDAASERLERLRAGLMASAPENDQSGPATAVPVEVQVHATTTSSAPRPAATPRPAVPQP